MLIFSVPLLILNGEVYANRWLFNLPKAGEKSRYGKVAENSRSGVYVPPRKIARLFYGALDLWITKTRPGHDEVALGIFLIDALLIYPEDLVSSFGSPPFKVFTDIFRHLHFLSWIWKSFPCVRGHPDCISF